MHLIVLENEPSSYRGGQELSLLAICKSLHQRGHQISLIYTRIGDLLEQYQDFCLQTIAVQGYKLNRHHPWQLAGDVYQAAQSIATDRDSLVYSNQYHDSFFGWGLARLKGIPLVCYLRLPPPSSWGIQAGLGLQGANRLIAISEQTKQDWMAAGFPAQKIDVVHNGIDLDKFQPALDRSIARSRWQLAETDPVVAYVGRLDKVKGVETLLRAIALLKPELPDLKLLIAGKPLIQQPQYQDFLKQLADQLNIADNVQFLGHVSQPAEVYQASNVVVVPSIWSEPLGRTLLEAMACGVPVVASRVGGIPEVLADEFAQGLFEPGNAADLGVKLRHFLSWQAQDSTLRQQCRAYVGDRFPLSKAVEGVEQVMLKLLAKGI
ncbi:MAG TPA: glycosyltransferase family 4 protein, partial [Coleofasciculaceae cyanobacterium]